MCAATVANVGYDHFGMVDGLLQRALPIGALLLGASDEGEQVGKVLELGEVAGSHGGDDILLEDTYE